MAPFSDPLDSTDVHHELLLELASDLSGSLDIGEVLTAALTATRKLIDFRGGSIALIEGGMLSIAVAVPAVGPEVAALRLPVGQGLSGRVAQTGRSIYSPDLQNDDRVDPGVRKLDTNSTIRTYFAVPVAAAGSVVGVLQVDSETVDAFTPEQRAMVASIAPLIGASIQNARVFTEELDTEQRLQHLEQLRSDFISITTHELRTPLTAMLGFAELLANEKGPPPGSQTAVEILERLGGSLERLTALIGELQRLAAVEADAMHLRQDALDLRSIVDKAVDPYVRARPIHVQVESDSTVIGDQDRLLDALRALLENALSFSPDGSPIEITAARTGSAIELSVIDDGGGVPAADSDKIFERFAQRESPRTRAIGGLGIGLPLARGIVERMGGTLKVVPGPRGHFVITLQEAL